MATLSPDQAFALGLVRDEKGNWSKLPKVSAEPPKDGVDLESKLHDDIWSFCNARGWAVYHSRMDRKTTGNVGYPDFAIYMENGVTAFVEAKARKEKPRTDQLGWAVHLKKLGHRHAFVWNMEQFRSFIASVRSEEPEIG